MGGLKRVDHGRSMAPCSSWNALFLRDQVGRLAWSSQAAFSQAPHVYGSGFGSPWPAAFFLSFAKNEWLGTWCATTRAQNPLQHLQQISIKESLLATTQLTRFTFAYFLSLLEGSKPLQMPRVTLGIIWGALHAPRDRTSTFVLAHLFRHLTMRTFEQWVVQLNSCYSKKPSALLAATIQLLFFKCRWVNEPGKYSSQDAKIQAADGGHMHLLSSASPTPPKL